MVPIQSPPIQRYLSTKNTVLSSQVVPSGKCDDCIVFYMSSDPEGKRVPKTHAKAYQLCVREDRCPPKLLSNSSPAQELISILTKL
ncbi:MAG TPA: hypothetical protein VIQ31_38560 [Phormidium sp.]